MNDIVFLLINGITVACIYGLVAVAVSITWSALGLLNLSYGFIFSFAGYGAWLAERYWWGYPTFVLLESFSLSFKKLSNCVSLNIYSSA